ncbi:MAG TPA: transaldolase, partial [Ktedonobacterales bacterium]
RLIDEDAVVGVTSNPTIFEKAIGGSSDYDDALRSLVSNGVRDPRKIFEALAIEDIQSAADILRPTYDRTQRYDGYISLEVAPDQANDTQATVADAGRLFAQVNRPNVMIKIPATAAGMPAIEQMIYEGVNINITLIFSLDVYRQVTEAYIRGLERRVADGKSVDHIASVASFFVSRVDTMIDKQLDEKIAASNDPAEQEHLRELRGKAAIANARLAYEMYEQIFHGERFAALRQAGAQYQRCLWASTSTKNPAYRDVIYVEELIGPETVDTMPPQTIVAFQDHGIPERTLGEYGEARATMAALASVGVDIDQVTKQLELDGVQSFYASYTSLLDSTAQKTAHLATEMGDHQASAETQQAAAVSAGALAGATAQATLAQGVTANETASETQGGGAADTLTGSARLGPLQGAVEETLGRAQSERFAQRVWQRDPAFWKPNPSEQKEITNRLGWLTVTDTMRDALPRLHDLRDHLRSDGVRDVVLLGMGGSSLAPEVLRETFGVSAGLPNLHVLDSTDPATISAVERAIDVAHTVFIVASKSGGTLETMSQFKYFFAKVSALTPGDAAQVGAHFIAITDAGTKLDALAQERKFRTIFRNPPDIGGRYSALSFFGLVPAAIIGVDVEKLLDRADAMRAACAAATPAERNPGVWLGTILGAGNRQGRDKVTIVVSPPI